MTNNEDINVTVESLQRLMNRRDDAVAETGRLRKHLNRLRAQRDDVLSLHRPAGTPEVCAICDTAWPCPTVIALAEMGR